MVKNRSVNVVVVVLLAMSFIIIAHSQYEAPDSYPKKDLSVAESSVYITPALDLNPASEDQLFAQDGFVDIVITQSPSPEMPENAQSDTDAQENPFTVFFSTLTTRIRTAGYMNADEETISIQVAHEDENTDQDVTNEVHIDIEKYPIVNTGNPDVLIYHTHTRESYTPDFSGQYVAAGSFRTNDRQYNVCAVGQKLARVLTEEYGFAVQHDTSMNEATPFTLSYDKSLQSVQACIAKNPELGIFIDVHRDSLGNSEYASRDIVTSGNKQYARILFVVGRGDGYSGTAAPNWQANYALAKAVSDKINSVLPGLSRGIMVKARRYNQQLSDKCMLIEFGYDANTILQAENSVDVVAQALSDVLGSRP